MVGLSGRAIPSYMDARPLTGLGLAGDERSDAALVDGEAIFGEWRDERGVGTGWKRGCGLWFSERHGRFLPEACRRV